MDIYKRFFALLQRKMRDEEEDPRSLEFKRNNLSSLSGTLVEIGPGAGTNFKYLPKDIRWIGVEPNQVINEELRKEARKQGIGQIEIINSSAGHLPMSDNTADAVLATFVMCSVGSQTDALSEIKRVLKPGGKYIFIEHVAAPKESWLRIYQNLLNPFQRLWANNCHLNRETANAIRAAGFKNVSLEIANVKKRFLPWPHMWGIAEK